MPAPKKKAGYKASLYMQEKEAAEMGPILLDIAYLIVKKMIEED